MTQFYTGVVEDRTTDPLKLGRCKVRIFGLHSENKQQLPTADLPWAIVMQPVTSAAMSGIGFSPVGPVEGSWVVVIFTDEDNQQPVIMGTLGGIPQKNSKTNSNYSEQGNSVKSTDGSVVTDSSGAPILSGTPTPSSPVTSASVGESKLASSLSLSQEGLTEIKSHEGLASLDKVVKRIGNDSTPAKTTLYPYKDTAGVWTIGWGSTYLLDDSKVNENTIISKEDADKLLMYKLEKEFVPAVKRNVKVPVTQSMFDSLVSMVYNMGSSGLFNSQIATSLNAGKYEEAAAFIPQTNTNKGTLTARRNKEQSYFLKNGVPSIDGSVTPMPVTTVEYKQLLDITKNPVVLGRSAMTSATASAAAIGNQVTQQAGNVVGNVTQQFGNVSQQVTGAVGNVTGALGSGITGAVGNVTGALGSGVTGAVGNVTGALGSGVTGAVGNITGALGGNITGALNGAVGNITGALGGGITGALGGAVGNVTGALGGAISGLFGASLNPTDENGFNDPNKVYPKWVDEPDTHRLARNESIDKTVVFSKEAARVLAVKKADGKTWDQPPNPYNAKYPYNHVFATESGHIEEWDDTKGSERRHSFHKSGTFYEIDSNGTRVTRIVGDDFEILERNGNVIIKGSCNVTIKGDSNVRVENDSTIQVLGNAKLNVTGNLTHAVSGDYKIKVKGQFAIDAKKIYFNSGVASGITLPIEPALGKPTFGELTTTNRHSDLNANFETPQEGSAKDFLTKNILDGKINPEENQSITTPTTAETTVPEKTANPSYTTCGDDIKNATSFTSGFKLTQQYTLGQICVGNSGIPSGVNYGLSANDIVCNLRLLVANCIEPIKARYPNMQISSAWRSEAYNTRIGGSKKSDHLKGMAIDFELKGFSRKQHYEAIIEIQKMLPAFRQLILEYKGATTWIHVAFNVNNNIMQALTIDAATNTTLKSGGYVLKE